MSESPSALQTPEDLINAGLYTPLALALYPGSFWPVSVALVAKALGAENRVRGKRSFCTTDAVLPASTVPHDRDEPQRSDVENPTDASFSSFGGSSFNTSHVPTSRIGHATSFKSAVASATSTTEGSAGRHQLLPGWGPNVTPSTAQVPSSVALPHPGYDRLQRSGAEHCRQSVLEVGEASGCQASHASVMESEGATVSCSPAESSSTSLNEQRVDKESVSKLERIRMRKASLTAGDDVWGSTSKEGPGREAFRGRGAVSSRNDGDSSVQQRKLGRRQQAEAVPQDGSLPNLQSAEESQPKPDAPFSSFGEASLCGGASPSFLLGEASFEASRLRRGSASLEREGVFRV